MTGQELYAKYLPVETKFAKVHIKGKLPDKIVIYRQEKPRPATLTEYIEPSK